MKKPIVFITTILFLTGCQNQQNLASSFSALTSGFFRSQDDKQMDRVVSSIRDGDIEKAEIEASQVATPFLKVQALGKIAHFQINEQNDLIGGKKSIDKMEQLIGEISSKEDKIYSQIEYADLMHFIDREKSFEIISRVTPEIWMVVDPSERSKLLIRLITLQLETQGDAKKAKTTIEQTQQTIGFINKSSARSMREKALKNVLQVNNHVLCKEL